MTTTFVPPYDGPIEPFDPEDLRTLVREWLGEAQGDCDKADLDDAAYYQGKVDVLEGVLAYLLGARGFDDDAHRFISDGADKCVWCNEVAAHDNHTRGEET